MREIRVEVRIARISGEGPACVRDRPVDDRQILLDDADGRAVEAARFSASTRSRSATAASYLAPARPAGRTAGAGSAGAGAVATGTGVV
jgi:hypothetical protein